MSSFFSICVVMKVFGISNIATYLPSFASIVSVRRTDSRSMIGDVASVFVSVVALFIAAGDHSSFNHLVPFLLQK